jgi:hypothetical protein
LNTVHAIDIARIVFGRRFALVRERLKSQALPQLTKLYRELPTVSALFSSIVLDLAKSIDFDPPELQRLPGFTSSLKGCL